jgi:hypothetical protein
MLDLNTPAKRKPFFMSLKLLLSDQINNLFETNKELSEVPKNDFEVAVCHFANLKHLCGQESDDLIDGIVGGGAILELICVIFFAMDF